MFYDIVSILSVAVLEGGIYIWAKFQKIQGAMIFGWGLYIWVGALYLGEGLHTISHTHTYTTVQWRGESSDSFLICVEPLTGVDDAGPTLKLGLTSEKCSDPLVAPRHTPLEDAPEGEREPGRRRASQPEALGRAAPPGERRGPGSPWRSGAGPGTWAGDRKLVRGEK